MPTAAKEKLVGEIRETLQGSAAAILTDYRGLSVADLTKLRRKLRESDTEFHIVKNTLFKLASTGVIKDESIYAQLEGPTGIGFVKGDTVAGAKAILEFIKDHKTMSIKGGYVEGKVLNQDQITALSKLPSKNVLIAQMLGSLNAPVSGLVGTLNGIISNFVFTIQAIADQKQAA